MSGNSLPRRTFVKTATVGAILGLAGCSGQTEDDGEAPAEDEQDEGNDSADGDEASADDQEETDGEGDDETPTANVIYAFAPDRIAVIEPESAEVVTELDADFQEADWGDILSSPDNRRLFANHANAAQVLVIDTEAHEIETRLDVGPDPTHMYHPRESEIWTHADEDGSFYIIDIDDLQVTDKVTAAQEDAGHGKLAYHEELGDIGYATNTNDPGVHIVDLEAKEVTGFIETHDDGGTHAKRYNPVSGHVYVEGTRDSRTAVVDPEENTTIDHFDIVGHIYNTPNDEYVVWVNEEQGVHVLDPEQGDFVAEIPVEGGPDKIFFHEEDDTVYGFTANTQNSKAAVIDFDQLEVVTEVEAGDILRPEGAEFLHRGGLTADGWFVTPASGGGVVSIIDAAAHELHAKVEVTEGVDTVAYVGSVE